MSAAISTEDKMGGGYQGRRGNWSVKEGTRTECKFPEKNANFVHLHDRPIFGWIFTKFATIRFQTIFSP
jgi:hypothetical protein